MIPIYNCIIQNIGGKSKTFLNIKKEKFLQYIVETFPVALYLMCRASVKPFMILALIPQTV